MIKSQVIVLKVVYEEDDHDGGQKFPPAEWNWDNLIDEPISNAVEVLAAGPLKSYPRPGENDPDE